MRDGGDWVGSRVGGWLWDDGGGRVRRRVVGSWLWLFGRGG